METENVPHIRDYQFPLEVSLLQIQRFLAANYYRKRALS